VFFIAIGDMKSFAYFQYMNPQQFTQLSDSDKQTVLLSATKLAERQEDQYKYELFEYNGFYIEARWSLLYNAINGIHAFNDHRYVDAYLTHTNLSDYQE
jgi:hypothetical protein